MIVKSNNESFGLRFTGWISIAFIVGMLFLSLSGCAGLTATKAAEYTADVFIITNSIRQVEANVDEALQAVEQSGFYTESETADIDRLIKNARFILSRADGILKTRDVKEIVVKSTEVEELIVSARNIYYELYDIVSRNFDKYPMSTQLKLKMLSENLIALDDAWKNVTKTPEGRDITPYLKTGVDIVGGIVKLLTIAAL